MTDDPEEPIAPFPAPPSGSPFPPLGREFETPAAPDPVADEREVADVPTDAPDQPVRDNAIAALGRFAFPPAPPLDDEGVAARDRRWTSRVVLGVAVLMLVFNPASIQNWSRQQEPGWGTATIQQLADVWSAQAAQLGADRPRQAVRDLWASLSELRFPGQDASGQDGS